MYLESIQGSRDVTNFDIFQKVSNFLVKYK